MRMVQRHIDFCERAVCMLVRGQAAAQRWRALAGVINLLDPDVIVLGGGLSNIARLYVTAPRL